MRHTCLRGVAIVRSWQAHSNPSRCVSLCDTAPHTLDTQCSDRSLQHTLLQLVRDKYGPGACNNRRAHCRFHSRIILFTG